MNTLPLGLFVLMLAVGLAVNAVGVSLFVVGLRGRRVGDHPHCRQCHFDLTGRPETSRHCPECGADLADRRAIVVGARARRRAWIVAGVLIAILGSLGTTLVTMRVAGRVDWQAAKPVWWLLRESRSDVRATRDAALDSLTRQERYDDSLLDPQRLRLSEADERRVIVRVLEVQADATVPWKQRWGEIVARRIVDGTLPAEQRDAFLRAALLPATLEVRTDIRAGDPLPMRLTLGTGRSSGAGRLAACYDDLDERTLFDGEPSSAPTGAGGGKSSLGNASITVWRREQARWLAGLALGPHTIEYRTVVRVRESFDDDAKEIAALPIAASATFTIHPKDATLVEFVDDESMRPAIEAGLSRIAIKVGPSTMGDLEIDGRNANFPMPLAFTMTIRQGEQSWPAGALATTAPRMSWGFGRSFKDLQPGKADVIFTSDPAAAAGSIDVVRAWRGEIVIKDVPVTIR